MITTKMTNVEFVTELMEFPDSGPLMQAFVIEALHNYAENVKQDTSAWPANSLVSQSAWKAIADEVIRKCAIKYGKGVGSNVNTVTDVIDKNATRAADDTKH